jgi:CheY-like chemotaxis protein
VAQFLALDLQEILKNLLKMLRRLIGENIELTFTGSASPLWVNADSGMVDQVLMNLCINARDAMPNGGKLILGTRLLEVTPELAASNPEARPGRFACLSVSDTGCGIEPSVLKRVFEPFFTTKDVGKGTGLGLATVYGIVKQHNGWLDVESAPGQGSCFKVYFPALSQAQGSTNPMRKSDAPRGGQETILIVEDEDSVRRMASLYLKRLGYQVTEAADGKEALRIWRASERPFRLLFTDMVMPEGMTGLDLADTLRKDDPLLKVILSSGYSTELLKIEGNLGSYTYLPKPYEAAVLARMIRTVLDK